jgi:hypothetical protein
VVVFRKFGFGHRGPPLDYAAFWSAGRLALQGQAAGAYDTAIIGPVQRGVVAMAPPSVFPFFYPPAALLIFAPLALLPYWASFTVFAAAQWWALIYILRRVLPRPWPTSTLVMAPAILLSTSIGQNGCLMAACLAAGSALVESRPGLAGAALGVLVIKPHIAVLVPAALLLGRQWRCLAAAAGVAAALLATSLMFGVAPWLSFLHASAQARAVVEGFAEDWEKMITPFAAVRLAGFSLPVAYAAQAAAAAIALLALIRCRNAAGAWLIAVLAAGTPLVSPYLFDYDLPLSLVPVAMVVAAAACGQWLAGEKLICALVFAAPFLARPIALSAHAGLMPLLSLALLAIVVRRAHRAGPSVSLAAAPPMH